jgi:hypothetical protein
VTNFSLLTSPNAVPADPEHPTLVYGFNFKHNNKTQFQRKCTTGLIERETKAPIGCKFGSHKIYLKERHAIKISIEAKAITNKKNTDAYHLKANQRCGQIFRS